MRARLRARKLTWCLAICLGIVLTVASPVGALSVKDPNYYGTWQYWGGGWRVMYVSETDTAYWSLNFNNRLEYQYTGGQWWDCDKFGAWRRIGASGVTDWWIGDGGWHNLNNGWNYYFVSSGDQSVWLKNGVNRFLYQYATGQWWNYGTSWYTLGAANTSSAFVGDGGWHNLNNGWNYYYVLSGDQSVWLKNGVNRFLYQYATGQWWDYGTSWYTLGAANTSSAFVGDGGWHNLNNGWNYYYVLSGDQSVWLKNGVNRFLYQYATGQWWDYTVNGWGRLGVGSLASSQFIGDGALHQFSTGDWFHGDGTSYYWYSGNHDRYQYVFGTGLWSWWTGSAWSSLTYSSTWQNPDCRYLYSAKFVESGLASDTGLYVPTGRKELQYNLYNFATGSRSLLTGWKIHNPGTDNRWSGGDLNVAWGNTRHWNGSAWVNDFTQRYGEFTKEDVIFFAADFEQNPIGFDTMVDWMTFVRDYYGKQIRTVQVNAHGNSEAWQMGEYMALWNYTSFEADWRRWGTLMTTDAQIISIHCETGNATAMLNAIANWSGCDIYANTNETWTAWYWISGNAENSSIWNSNYNNVTWYDNSQSGIQRVFEYRSPGAPLDYRWLFSL